MQIRQRFFQDNHGQAFKSLLGCLLPVVFVAMFVVVQCLDFDQAGLRSGFSHPLMGFDHLLTMLAVGIWAAQLRGHAVWQLPLTFVAVMSLGGLAGSTGLNIPVVEGIILLSCAVFSILITRKIRFSAKINVLLVAFFAFFHGYAHGQEISTSASLLSYTAGFMLATLLLHGAGILIAKLVILTVSALFAILISTASQAGWTDSQKSSENDARELAAEQIPFVNQSKLHATSPAVDESSGGFLQTDLPRSPKIDHTWKELEQNQSRSDFLQILFVQKNRQDQEAKIVRCSFKTGFPAINHTPGLALASSGVGRASPPLGSDFTDLSSVFVSAPNSQNLRFSAVVAQYSRQQLAGFTAFYPRPYQSPFNLLENSLRAEFFHQFMRLV